MAGPDNAGAADTGRTRKVLRAAVLPEGDGEKLERYLRKNLEFTRAQIRSMKFRPDGIVVNGRRTRVSYILQAGDVLELRLEAEKASSEHLGMCPETGEMLSERLGMCPKVEEASSDRPEIYSEEKKTSAGWSGDSRAGDADCEVEPPLSVWLKQHVLYEDGDMILVWKDAGQVIHPAHGHHADTLSNLLHACFEVKKEKVVIRSIGRLDRDTSGIVVFAKNKTAAGRLWRQKEQGIFWKEYLALCEGHFPEAGAKQTQGCVLSGRGQWISGLPGCGQQKSGLSGVVLPGCGQWNPALPGDDLDLPGGSLPGLNWQVIDAPIAPASGELMKMCICPEGKPAVTYYQVAEQYENCALLRVRIATGRTHQIRVHMAYLGHPLVGDVLYGNESECGSGLQLCAWKVRLLQPFTGEEITVQKEPVTAYQI